MAHIAHCERRDAHLDLFWFVDSYLCLISTSSTIILLSKLGEIGDLIERAIFAMRINNQYTCFIMRLNQYHYKDAGKVAFTTTSPAQEFQEWCIPLFYVLHLITLI